MAVIPKCLMQHLWNALNSSLNSTFHSHLDCLISNPCGGRQRQNYENLWYCPNTYGPDWNDHSEAAFSRSYWWSASFPYFPVQNSSTFWPLPFSLDFDNLFVYTNPVYMCLIPACDLLIWLIYGSATIYVKYSATKYAMLASSISLPHQYIIASMHSCKSGNIF